MANHLESIPSFANWIEVLQHWSGERPDAQAFCYLADGEAEEIHQTYADLDRQARSVGAMLQELGAQNERVLLLYPPGLEFITGFMGCIFGGAVAVPAYPPEPARFARTLPRLQAIIADAQPQVVLTTTPILSLVEALFESVPEFKTMRWVATDTLADHADAWQRPSIRQESLAFLQYTSGSTGTPKGVMVGHDNLLHNSRSIQKGFGHSDDLVGVGWLPLYHDMGLIGKVLQPLYLGRPCTLLSPLDFLKRPLRWLQAISRYRATTSGGPNFAYDLCVRKITPEQRKTIDLSSWKVAFVGAEPVRAETLERFANTFEECGFRREALFPCYGLAESTLMVTGGWLGSGASMVDVSTEALQLAQAQEARDDQDLATRLVSSGRVAPDHRVVIADPERKTRCSAGQVGEIWLSGPSVTHGYWNRPAETVETFAGHLSDTGEGPFLRTGDLGFERDGELFVTGRCKDLIILHGRNHYPQDVEHSVERSHAALRPGCVAAFSIEADGQERLVVVAEVDRRHADLQDTSGILAAVRQAITDQHELLPHAVILLQPGTLPKTSSGKVQRQACKLSFAARSLEIIEAWHELEDPRAPAAAEDESSSVYVDLTAKCAKIDRRSTRYRFDLEKDIRWDQLDAPGDYFSPRWLDRIGVDVDMLRRIPAAYELFQWALALATCNAFIDLEQTLLQFIMAEQRHLGSSRSLVMFQEEEEKHIELFQRYADHLRKQKPEHVRAFDEHFASCAHAHARTLQNPLGLKEVVHHYLFWLYAILIEDYSIYVYDELLPDAASLQPAWLSAHAAHKREELQHVVTDVAHIHALNLSPEEREQFSKHWFHPTVAQFGRMQGVEAAHRVLVDSYPELERAVESPIRMHPHLLAAVLQDRTFSRTREAAPYLLELAADADVAVDEMLGKTNASVLSPAAMRVQDWLIARISARLGLDPLALDPCVRFTFYGLDSIVAAEIAAEIEEWLGRPVPVTVFYEYPTVELLARHAAADAPTAGGTHGGPVAVHRHPESLNHLPRPLPLG